MAAAALLLALTLGTAFANGANDVSKGVATLVGSGLSNVRQALAWGTAWTVAGALGAVFVSQGLVAAFSGGGVLTAGTAGPLLPASAAFGALGWLVIATYTGLPVSTTHALIGGLVGAGTVAVGFGGVAWSGVAYKVALPLAVSPLLALVLVSALFRPITLAFQRLGPYCVCLERHQLGLVPATVGPRIAAGSALRVVAGTACPPEVLTRVNALDSLHWLSAGLTSLARGLNDAPKVLGLGLLGAAALGLDPAALGILVALAMGGGSYVAGRRVTRTLAEGVTRIAPDDGLAGNLVTATLVGFASLVAAPVSTTHVSSGAIVGIGLHRSDVRWKLVRELLLAWLVTVPVAAVLAGAAYALIGR